MPVIVYLLYYQLLRYRYRKFAHIPTTLKPNLFLGHIPYMIAGFKKYGNSKMHPGISSLTGRSNDLLTSFRLRS